MAMIKAISKDGVPFHANGQPVDTKEYPYIVVSGDECYLFETEEQHSTFMDGLAKDMKALFDKRFQEAVAAEELIVQPS